MEEILGKFLHQYVRFVFSTSNEQEGKQVNNSTSFHRFYFFWNSFPQKFSIWSIKGKKDSEIIEPTTSRKEIVVTNKQQGLYPENYKYRLT